MNPTTTPNAGQPAKPVNVWMIVSIVLAVIVIGLIAVLISKQGGSASGALPQNQASDRLMSFINEVYGPRIGQSQLKSISEEHGLYKVVVTVNNQGKASDETVFLTKDAKIFVTQSLDIDQALAAFRQSQQAGAQPGQGQQAPTNTNTAPAAPAATTTAPNTK